MLRAQLRDRITMPAIALALLALVLGLGSLTNSYNAGIHWTTRDGKLVVDWVEPGSQADADRITPGMIAIEVNGWQLIQLPSPVFGDPDPNLPDDQAPILRYVPTAPVNDASAAAQLVGSSRFPISSLQLITPSSLAQGTPDQYA
ncbi:MAG: hypothetical protein ABIZ72_04880, partial [Candidatus Limnocylindrales bacterium]